MSQNHALVFGASGISGWAVLNQLRSYPTPSHWGKITAFTNRPFSFEQAQIAPEERIQLVSGVDLTESPDKIVNNIKAKGADISTATHVFFFAYIEKEGFEALAGINNLLLTNTIEAVEAVAPNLQSVILQTGGKGYGLEFPDKLTMKAPLSEDMPRIPEPYASKIFYYTQYDILKEKSKGKKWTFTEIRPDAIVGFVPGTNYMNLAQGIALYLSIYRIVHGAGAEVAFPGTQKSYTSTHSDSFQDLVARMEIFAATNPEKCGNGRAFNIADVDEPVSWADVWRDVAPYFGLRGVGPKSEKTDMAQFVAQHKEVWQKYCKENGLVVDAAETQNWGFVQFILVDFDFDRQYDLSRARSVGFGESQPTAQGYKIAFDRMVGAKVIPKF